MTTVGEILNFVECVAPRYMKMDWDHVGLLCGGADREVHKVLVALDPFEHVCQEAAAWGAELLVTHHPLIFRPLTSITDETAVGRSVQILCRNGISAINAHTNLDCAPGGVNDVLAHALGLTAVTVINPSGQDAQGSNWGLLRKGTVQRQSLEMFLANVKAALYCSGLRYVDGGTDVHHVAVGGGACADSLLEAKLAGCDTFITADVKYNQFWDAHDLGINLIDAGHFYTENPVISILAEKIAAAFPSVEVKISEKHTDCMKFY